MPLLLQAQAQVLAGEQAAAPAPAEAPQPARESREESAFQQLAAPKARLAAEEEHPAVAAQQREQECSLAAPTLAQRHYCLWQKRANLPQPVANS